ncbi:type VI secretion system baseplate subunit TssF, partial [Enterobacter roggenkampii]|uniref:type VI secretion system baseplate subunit TssF n=1 Tax=Enterobacter roggenkampii TaxID=1812935 RepID=UPI000B2E65C8
GRHAGIVCQTVSPQPQRQLLATDALRQEGFEPDQALLPDDLRNFDGYRLLQEYFAFPARFRFISLSGLSTLIQRCEGEKAFDIFILLDKSDEQLERVVDASHLALHCTPVINLFPKVAARQKLNDGQHEYHLVVDNIRPLDYEIYAVKKIYGSADGQRDDQTFRPFWSTWSGDAGNYGAYFSLRREQRVLFIHQRDEDLRADIAGTGAVAQGVLGQHALLASQGKIGPVVARIAAPGAPE